MKIRPMPVAITGRDLLLAVRAVIDWYLEKLDGDRGPEGPEVEDIPLD